MFTRQMIYWILSVAYLGIGLFFFWAKLIPSPWNVVFAIACFIVAGLRAWRGWQLSDQDGTE